MKKNRLSHQVSGYISYSCSLSTFHYSTIILVPPPTYHLLAMYSFVLCSCLALFATTEAAGPLAQIASGPAACASLTSSLGANKVISSQLNPNYIETTYNYWNSKQSQYTPSCIVYPVSSQDVSISLKAIKAAGSRFAIKAGGHNPNTFYSSVEDGVLISLEKMTTRSYDSKTTLATYQPGGTFGDIYEYFLQYHRTVVGARLAGVGTGLALGGGLSFLSGQYGMAVDSFRELEVVLPSGDIVTASATKNPDLFFACKGGGGNAYGVVTKYTVQSRPAGTFYAGNLIYALQQNNDVLEAIGNFTSYNTDPKASIIGTYEKLLTPETDFNLDSAIVMFLVYDGPDPGKAFDNFTKLNPLINTMGQKNYLEVVNMPIPLSTQITRGYNIFRVAVHGDPASDQGFIAHYNAWDAWCEANKGDYVLSSVDFQPIAKSLTDASKTQGGNAMNMPSGPWIWLNFLINTPPTQSNGTYNAVQESFRDMVNSVQNKAGLPLFLNDANYDQNPLKTFSTYRKLQTLKKRYDPDGFFAKHTGGWNFNA